MTLRRIHEIQRLSLFQQAAEAVETYTAHTASHLKKPGVLLLLRFKVQQLKIMGNIKLLNEPAHFPMLGCLNAGRCIHRNHHLNGNTT
jgi:hypothetical protein